MVEQVESTNAWLNTLVRSLSSREHSPLGDALPDFPPEELQRNTTGLSSEAALRQAHAFYSDVVNAAAKAGFDLGPNTRALDFGFGWGRISRVFMERLRLANIHGLDVDSSFTDITRALFNSTNFNTCSAFPPTALAAGEFDLVYAYSVFSHLSESACQAWMQEFARVLRPGGLVAFTTRHESFFDYCQWASTQPDDGSYTAALGKLFSDLGPARQAYRDGQLVFASSSGVDGGGPRNSSFYGETWIPEAYARTKFGGSFEFVAGYFDASKYDQACFVLKRT